MILSVDVILLPSIASMAMEAGSAGNARSPQSRMDNVLIDIRDSVVSVQCLS